MWYVIKMVKQEVSLVKAIDLLSSFIMFAFTLLLSLQHLKVIKSIKSSDSLKQPT